jgi:hypothetical protein
VRNELERLHEEFVLVPADKACNNIVFVCKAHYYNCILNELGINSTVGNPTYTPTALSKDEILQNHRSVLDTFNIPINGMNEFELPYLHWIPKLNKNPYKVLERSQIQRASVFQMAAEFYFYYGFCGRLCKTMGKIRKRRT